MFNYSLLKVKMLKDAGNRRGVINFVIIMKELRSDIASDTKNFELSEFYRYCVEELFNWIGSDTGKNTLWNVLGDFLSKDPRAFDLFFTEIVD